MIDLRPRQLEAFLAVAAELHFSRAAQRLGIAQSAVSQQVRRLEQALGVELLTRTSRRVQLTPAGEALRRQAPGLLGRIDGLAHTVQALAAGEAGTVVLGAQGAALIGIVPQALQRLGAELPQLQVVVRQLTSREQVEGLRLGTLDLALVRDLALKTTSSSPNYTENQSSPCCLKTTRWRASQLSTSPISPTTRSSSGTERERPTSMTP